MSSKRSVEQLVAEWERLRDQNLPVTTDDLCRDCPELLPQLRQRLAELQAAASPPSPSQVSTVTQAVESVSETGAAPPDAGWPAIPGYEILGELGHGGMGVVYHARQLALKRTVALKMMLARQQGRDSGSARFQREMEAVAQLQHPHIVQIYEVGSHDGQPYFSLEYVAGGSLDRQLVRQPQPGRAAAELVETLARAMHHAHQRQIIHRDLKPANVLLTADGAPKITDFGLAKQLDTDSGQTQSGMILGTPSYMAPEQAQGKIHEVGPLTDVYALGAILYEMLTGRPPYRGATPWETVQQVLTQEVVPPSRWQPRVHRDLETICLKALARVPGQRYGSALALAEDLGRFQAGEAILGRREPVAAKLWRKVRRNPVVSAAVVALVLAGVLAVVVVPQATSAMARARQITVLQGRVEAGLEAVELSEAYLQRLEGDLEALERLVPGTAATLRPRLHQRFAEALRGQFRDRLVEAEMPRIEAAIGLLAGRDEGLMQEVRQDYDARRRTWRPVFELAAPFGELPAVFDPAGVLIDPMGTTLTRSRGRTVEVLTRQACAHEVKFQAVFAPSWATTAEIGLLLNVAPGQRYAFLLRMDRTFRPVDAQGQAIPLKTFEEIRKAEGSLRLEILRNQELLSASRLPAAAVFSPDGRLMLEATREGAVLTFQVNRQEPMKYRDLLPLSTTSPGVFGLHWPTGAALQGLHADYRPGSARPGPLEQGDDWYNRGEQEKAAQFYQQAALNAREEPLRQEALYKQGLCYRALNREDDALAAFQAVPDRAAAAAGGNLQEHWPFLADCQQVLIYLHRNDAASKKQADLVLDRLFLRAGGRRPELALLIPAKDRGTITGKRSIPKADAFLRPMPDVVRDYERNLRVLDVFGTDWEDRMWVRQDLFLIYWVAGRNLEAMQTAEELLRKGFQNKAVRLMDLYCWFLRAQGDPQRALARMDLHLHESKYLLKHHNLVERARIHLALKNEKQALDDLDQFFALQKKTDKVDAYTYGTYSGACLLQGFQLRAQGNEQEAQRAWQKGLVQSWRSEQPGVSLAAVEAGQQAYVNRIHNLILASLTNQVGQREAEDYLVYIGGVLGGDASAAAFFKQVGSTPAVVQQMWRSERGLHWARKVAERDLSYAEFTQVPIYLFAAELLHQGAMPGPLTREQDDLIWDLVRQLHGAYVDGKVTMPQLLQMGLIWRSPLGYAFGMPAMSQVDPPLRGPLAYLGGQRYRRIFKKPGEAATLFETALKDAPPNSPLQRLAQMELDGLKKK